MSCKAMGMGGGIIVAGIFAGVGVYSCGPNVIVGALGVTITGILAVKEKVNKVFLENRIATTTHEAEIQDLKGRIGVTHAHQQKHLRLCYLFAWSMIPFVGPFVAMTKSESPL